ncbi:hypothetical protein HDE78_001452 [Rhodanobacter sp. K2T2]|uniref:hypothetical protein n=1 Tax=Rhodanobacter sp. K2T2 TaxID=2723085 RepID=UPI0015CCB90F|nr:hypothetical protein [Rhodanobacter sp. K2T2]NYE28500.1 hypothetical protein [Rhodanobacter sp. K2T2]
MNNFYPPRNSASARFRTHLRHMVALLTIVVCLSARPAHAQWSVTDNTPGDNTDKTATNTKNIATSTDNIDKHLAIGSYGSPGDRLADPKQYPLATSTTLQQDLQQCSKLAQTQQQNCQEIANTEDAQYQYMVTMYTNTAIRNNRLQAILNERQGIQSTDYGKLEDNTNKLTALYTLMAIDSQQMQSINYAYNTRLRYLRIQQTQLANAAATGTPPNSSLDIGGLPVGSIINALTTGAALKVALNGVQSPTPSGMLTLSTEQSNGF